MFKEANPEHLKVKGSQSLSFLPVVLETLWGWNSIPSKISLDFFIIGEMRFSPQVFLKWYQANCAYLL